MRSPISKSFFSFWLVFALLLQSCGGGGSSSTPAVTPVNLSGTAAKGAAVAGATITVKDAAGVSKTATTGADGKYTIDVAGMTAPFLIKVNLPGGTALYSVGTQAGTVNIHPFTDLIIRTWYQVQGKTMDAAFGDPAGNPAPTATEVRVIAGVVKEIVQKWLVDNGIDPTNFDLITTSFDANHSGFDHVLDLSTVASGTVTITDGTTSQTTTLTPHTDTNGVSVSTTTTGPGGTSSSESSTIVPANAAQKAALSGVNTTLGQLAATVNSKGTNLADADLAGYFDTGYKNDGNRADVDTAFLADELRGKTINAFTIQKLLSYDDANKIVQVAAIASTPEAKLTPVASANLAEGGFVGGTFYKQQVDGSWKIYGNQRIAQADASVLMENRMVSTCPAATCATQELKRGVVAPAGTVTGVTVTGAPGNLTMTSSTSLTNTVHPTPTTMRDIHLDSFFDERTASPLPPVGSIYTFQVTPSVGSVQTYTDALQGRTTEVISITSPTGYAIADAKLNTPLTVNWTLPTTFPIFAVQLMGMVHASGGGICEIGVNQVLAPTATSAAITLPSTCNGQAIDTTLNPPEVQVDVLGIHGEETRVKHIFK